MDDREREIGSRDVDLLPRVDIGQQDEGEHQHQGQHHGAENPRLSHVFGWFHGIGGGHFTQAMSCGRCSGSFSERWRVLAFHRARAAAEPSAGTRTVKRAPPKGLVAATTEPPCSTTIFFTMASPRPVPSRLPVTYGSKMAAFSALSKPGPLSSTWTSQ